MKLSRQLRRGFVSRKIVESLLANKGINVIARAQRVGKATIRKIKKRAEDKGYLNGTVPLPPFPELLFPEDKKIREFASEVDDRLGEHLPWIIDRLGVGWHAITVFEELPVKVNRSSFYRFLARHDLNPTARRPSRVVPEIVHRPGEALLVDWGKVATVVCPVSGKKRTVWAFVGVLGYSRYRMVRLTMSLDLDTTLSHLESMLQEIGGVPVKITSDNPKVFALKACRFEPLLNPIYERFAGYYGAAVECLPPADPEKKGKVERPIPYVRRLFESYSGDWLDLKVAQDFIDKKLGLANDQRHGTTGERPLERLLESEVSALKSLPKLLWNREEFHEGPVRQDGHICFRGKYYSLSEPLIGETLAVIGNQNLVWMYHKGKLVETHERCWDPLRSKVTKAEHLKPWERAMNDTSVYRSRAQTLGPHVDELVVRIIGNGLGVIDFRRVWGLLSLDKTYSASAIDEACKKALAMGSTRLRTVQSLLRVERAAPPSTLAEYSPVSDEERARERIHRYTRDIKEYGAMVAQATKH